uniref:tRNA-splicing endonuclease subunit Sen15 domain-containing protein n=1 Tax=Anopheles minimus TaxID=112268 RepID=A0A182WIL4_9DIPT
MLNYQEIAKGLHSLGCNDEARCYAACRCYVYLKEEKCMSDVHCQYQKELELLYLIARKEPEAAYHLFIPSLTTDTLDLVRLKHYRDIITLPDGGKPDSVVLAICDPSSTVLLYRMTANLKEIGRKLPSKGKLLRLKANTGCDKGNQRRNLNQVK